MGEFDQRLLTSITFFPLVTALGLMATSILARLLGANGLPAALWKPIALASSILTCLLSLRLFAVFDPLGNVVLKHVNFADAEFMVGFLAEGLELSLR